MAPPWHQVASAVPANLPRFFRACGAAEGIRTPDPRITNAVLYQLSYSGIGAHVARFALSGKSPSPRPTWEAFADRERINEWRVMLVKGAVWYNAGMVKTLEQAIAQVAILPDADQEQIGRQLLSHVEKLRQLREEIDKGIRSLDAGEGKPLDIEDFLRRENERYGRP